MQLLLEKAVHPRKRPTVWSLAKRLLLSPLVLAMGLLFNTSEAAATLTVGTDAFRNERKRTTSRLRVMTGLIIVGGNAINEAAIDFFIEDFFVGTYRNSRSGVAAPIVPDDVQVVGNHAIPPGSQVAALVRVAPTVSPLLIQVLGQE